MSAIETLPYGGARRACRALRERRLRPHDNRLQLLPQPALPQVSGGGFARLDGGAGGRVAARPYFHVVFTLPAEVADIAYQNKRVDLRPAVQGKSAKRCRPLPPIPSTSAPRSPITSVLHTWGSAMTHHPHVHMIVPGGGLSITKGRAKARNKRQWIACRKGFFLPVRALSKLFRRLMLDKLADAHVADKLAFFGAHAHLTEHRAFKRFLRPLRRRKWFVYAKRPFANCSALPNPSRLKRKTAKPLPRTRPHSGHARAVAAKCGSSRHSLPGASRATSPNRKASTAHETSPLSIRSATTAICASQ